MLQLCMWRSSKVIGNDNIRYNAHEFVLVFYCNDGHIAVSSPSGRKRLLGTYWAPISCMVETILVPFSAEQYIHGSKKAIHGTISLTDSDRMQHRWPQFPKHSGFYPPNIESKSSSPPFLKLPLPYIPQLASKIYLCKTQMSKCTMRIDVTTTRIVSNKFILHGIQRKQWSKWNIGAHSTKSLQ